LKLYISGSAKVRIICYVYHVVGI